MTEQATNEQIVTEEFRVAFPNLFEPSAPVINGKAQGEPMYSVVMLFDSEDKVKPLKEAAVRVAKAKWGENVDLKSLRFPFKRGDEEAKKASQKGKDGSFYEGTTVLKANSKYAPGVVGPDKQDLLDRQAIYSGSYGRAEVNIVAYDGPGDAPDGVKAYINFYMKTRDGQRIAGRTAKDVFSNVEGSSTHEDPTGGDLMDDIPF